MIHHWLAERGLVPVTFSSSEVSLFVNCNASDDLLFLKKGRIDLPLTLWCKGSEVNELLERCLGMQGPHTLLFKCKCVKKERVLKIPGEACFTTPPPGLNKKVEKGKATIFYVNNS